MNRNNIGAGKWIQMRMADRAFYLISFGLVIYNNIGTFRALPACQG